MRVRAGDLELRDDAPTAGQRDGRELLLVGALAIRLDGKGRRRGAVEEDRSAVEEALAADGRVRVVRELASLAGSQVEKKDLWRFVPGRVKRAEIDQGDGPAVGADREEFPVVTKR